MLAADLEQGPQVPHAGHWGVHIVTTRRLHSSKRTSRMINQLKATSQAPLSPRLNAHAADRSAGLTREAHRAAVHGKHRGAERVCAAYAGRKVVCAHLAAEEGGDGAVQVRRQLRVHIRVPTDERLQHRLAIEGSGAAGAQSSK